MTTELDLYKSFMSELKESIKDCENAESFMLGIQNSIKSLDKKLTSFRENQALFSNKESAKHFIDSYLSCQEEEEKYKAIGFAKRDEILKSLFDGTEEMIDEYQISYHPDQYSFNSKEFMGLYNYLADLCDADERSISFPESRRYFIYKGNRFIWRMIVGQGTACQLVLESKTWPVDWPMIFDESKMITIQS